MQAWFAAVLRDGFAAQLAGRFQPFKEHGSYHLDCLLRAAGVSGVTGQDAAQQVMKAWQEAQPYPDVGPGIRGLHAAGVQVAALTNGSEALARAVLGTAGVEQLVSPILDIAMAQAWKPAPQAYQYALGMLGHEAHEVSHPALDPQPFHTRRAPRAHSAQERGARHFKTWLPGGAGLQRAHAGGGSHLWGMGALRTLLHGVFSTGAGGAVVCMPWLLMAALNNLGLGTSRLGAAGTRSLSTPLCAGDDGGLASLGHPRCYARWAAGRVRPAQLLGALPALPHAWALFGGWFFHGARGAGAEQQGLSALHAVCRPLKVLACPLSCSIKRF